MGISVHWSWLAVLSCLICMAGEVQCDCTEANMQIADGRYTMTKKLERGSILEYHCDEGYYPYPHTVRVCQADGRWNPLPKRFLPQRCRRVECPDPNVLQYGNVIPPQEKYFVDNETVYDCYSGYTLRGSSARRCLPNGKWNGSTPICSRGSTDDTCPDPGIPPGASRTGNIFGIDDKVKYTCNGNLFLVGSSERVCKENGQWTGEEPACYYKHTYDTSLEVSEAFGSAIKSSLTTLESVDDIQGERKIRISKNGTLNIYIAMDISESIEEKHFKSARNAVIKLIEKISSFSVTPNYEIVFFSSEIHEVANILDFLDGKASLDSVRERLKNFTIGDKNSGTDLNIVFKTFWEKMSIIKQRAGEEGFKEHRHALIFFTDGAYNMGGSPLPNVERIKNMVYMNNTSDQQKESREDYLDIYIFAIGADIFDDDLQPLTVGKGGKHYFRMKDILDLQDTFDEIIDEEEVKGQCGLHREYDPTKPVHKKMFPWAAFVIVGNNRCLGSLVTPRFVLTAAHCFKFDDTPDRVTVEIDDGQGRVKKVETYMLHPKYNITAKVKKGVKEFYDFDVALIQLKKDINISSFARPICIPCTQEASNALKLGDHSTCKQHEKLLFKDQIERLNFLTRKDNSVALKDVHAKLGDNREECIKHALSAAGITTKDVHEAVTDSFLCTGGVSHQRDHIACTGDSGGAVFKNYQHRTVQVALVSWGSKEMCKGGGVVESDQYSRDFHINLFKVIPFLRDILGKDTDEYAPLTFLNDEES